MREMDQMAFEAASDEQKLTSFIKQHEAFILKCASKAARKYLTKSDDEWSLAQLAFADAVRSYDKEKGSFYSLAELFIRRKLIDYHRAQQKFSLEQAVDPGLFSTDPEDGDEDAYVIRRALFHQAQSREGEELKLEIEAISERLSEYGFSFLDLTACSPKSRKTRQSCARAVKTLLNHPLLISDLQNAKRLSIHLIEEKTGIPRKILERHRKYIIAATEILSGDYPLLAEYLKFIGKETGG